MWASVLPATTEPNAAPRAAAGASAPFPHAESAVAPSAAMGGMGSEEVKRCNKKLSTGCVVYLKVRGT